MFILYYMENITIPIAVRIKSEALALDHTYLPFSTESSQCGVGDLYRLSLNPMIDEVYVCFEAGDAYYRDSIKQ